MYESTEAMNYEDTKAYLTEVKNPCIFLMLDGSKSVEEQMYKVWEVNDGTTDINKLLTTVIKPERMQVAGRIPVEKYEKDHQFTEEEIEKINNEGQLWHVYYPGEALVKLAFVGYQTMPDEQNSSQINILDFSESSGNTLFDDEELKLTSGQVDDLLKNNVPFSKDTLEEVQTHYRAYLQEGDRGYRLFELTEFNTLPIPEFVGVREVGLNVVILIKPNTIELPTLDEVEIKESDEYILFESVGKEDNKVVNGFIIPAGDKYYSSVTGKSVDITYDELRECKLLDTATKDNKPKLSLVSKT